MALAHYKARMDMDRDRIQKGLDEAWAQYERMRNAPPPQYPFWLLCKVIGITLRGKRQIDRIQLHSPYRITYKNEMTA